jgi:hypothetical protein
MILNGRGTGKGNRGTIRHDGATGVTPVRFARSQLLLCQLLKRMLTAAGSVHAEERVTAFFPPLRIIDDDSCASLVDFSCNKIIETL